MGKTAEGQQPLAVPLSLDEMIRQASSAIQEAASRGQTKQIVRVLLPRDASSTDLGNYFEGESTMTGSQKLVPPDESWQGGIMQLYRPASTTCLDLLQKITQDEISGLPQRINEDRSVDDSGVDGIGLFEAEDKSISCWLQPTQEVISDVIDYAEKADDGNVVVLMNPQWRMVDDALDTASKGEGFLAGFASFLGGKGGTLRQLSEAGFKPVYTFEGYVCRGANVRLLQCLDSDWSVFCERDDGESYIAVGSLPTRPSYKEVDQMLQDSNIGFRFARDIG